MDQQFELTLSPLQQDGPKSALASVAGGMHATVRTIIQPTDSLQLLTDTVSTHSTHGSQVICHLAVLHSRHCMLLLLAAQSRFDVG